MSEPYPGPACPFCGSEDTLHYTPGTALLLGFRTECITCRTRWNFPSGYPADFGRQLGVTRQAVQQRFGGDAP